MLKKVKPMLATLVEKPFDNKEWLFETKWDGYRAIGEIHNGKVLLYSRNQQSFNERFKPIVEDLEKFDFTAILDGEIVLLDKSGKPSFQGIQNFQNQQEGSLVYYVFDILYLNGEDLRHRPLIERKEILKKILPKTKHVRYCSHVKGKGLEAFKKAEKNDLEGIIAKRISSIYQEGRRSRDWLKIKTHKRQEVVICGFTEPKGSREYFGSLILGVYENGHLVYVGNTGSGFDHQKLKEIHNRLEKLVQTKSPFANAPKIYGHLTWVKPKLVCEVKFAEWTTDGQMRQPIFIDLRDDKKPKEVKKEKEIIYEKEISKK